MIRQILIAKTVDDQNIVLMTADGVDGINEIRSTLKSASTDRCFEVTDPEGEVRECLYLEHWHRSGGVERVVRLKTKEQLAEMAKNETERVAAQKAELDALSAIGNDGTSEAPEETAAEEPEAPEETETEEPEAPEETETEEPEAPEETETEEPEKKPKRRGRKK